MKIPKSVNNFFKSNSLIKILFLKQEKEFWYDAIVNNSRESISFSESIEPLEQYQNNFDKMCEWVSKYNNCKNKERFFKSFWKERESYLLATTSINEMSGYLNDNVASALEELQIALI